MNDEISLRQEELRYIKNDAIEIEKDTLLIKDDIKRYNKQITDIRVIHRFYF